MRSISFFILIYLFVFPVYLLAQGNGGSGGKCWEEIQTLGCGTPRGDREKFRECIESNKSKLSAECLKIHEEKHKMGQDKPGGQGNQKGQMQRSSCMAEFQKLDCGTPRDDREKFGECIETNKSKLSAECLKMHEERHKNRPNMGSKAGK